MPWAALGLVSLGAYLGVSGLSFTSDVGDEVGQTVDSLFRLMFLIIVTAAGTAFIAALAAYAWQLGIKKR
jgi:hypothetical protein